MAVIDKLTPEQEARLPEYRDRFIKAGMAVGPCDRPLVEKFCKLSYNLAGLVYPPDARFVKDETGPDGRMFVDDPANIPEGVTIPPEGLLVRNCTTNGPGKVYWTGGPTSGYDKAQELDPGNEWRCTYGSQEAAWLAFHAFMGEVVGVAGPEKLAGLQGMLNSGWWCPYDEAVILTELPTHIKVDDRLRVHCTDGPAILYPDGTDVWAIHGVDIPPDLLTKPLTVAVINGQRNAEVRRELVNLYGEDKYVEDMGAELLAEDEYGKIYTYRIPGETEAVVAVRVVNSTPEPDGTYKVYWFRVHPECRPLLSERDFGDPQPVTPRNAIASMYGLRGEEYAPEVET